MAQSIVIDRAGYTSVAMRRSLQLVLSLLARERTTVSDLVARDPSAHQ